MGISEVVIGPVKVDQTRRQQWEALYRAAFPPLYRAVSAVLLDSDRALDALHDAFLEGLAHPPPHDGNLQGWLYRVALRKAQRRLPFGSLAKRETANTELSQVLDRIEVGSLLRLLTERQRRVVVARYYLELRHQEIAELLHMRTGTVSATLNQAIAKMRKEARHGA